MRRGLDLGAVGQDQPVYVAARRQRELLDLPALSRKLLWVIERRLPGRRGQLICKRLRLILRKRVGAQRQ